MTPPLKKYRLQFLLLLLLLVGCGTIFVFTFDINKYNLKHSVRRNLGEDYSQFALALDLDGNGLTVSKIGYVPDGSHVFFDLDNDDFAERTAWVIGGDGFLAIDINKNAKIDNQSELFGNSKKYFDGFSKLSSIDDNGDGVINQADNTFSKLLVWVDEDQNGQSSTNELFPLPALDISEVVYKNPQDMDESLNESYINMSSTFVRAGKKLNIYNIWLRNSASETIYLKKVNIDPRVLFLPTLKGYGELSDLHIAMSEDSELLKMVLNFVTSWNTANFKDYRRLDSQFNDILFRWAKVDGVRDGSRGEFSNAKEISFIEKLTGRGYGVNTKSKMYKDPVNDEQGKAVRKSFLCASGALKSMFLVQAGLSKLFEPPVRYNLGAGAINDGNLSHSGIDQLIEVAKNIEPTKREDYWVGVVEFLLNLKPQKSLSSEEVSMLRQAMSGTIGSGKWEDVFLRVKENGLGDMKLTGSVGEDYQVTSNGNDIIEGNSGNDILIGMAGNDVLQGGDGDDRYVFAAGDGVDTIKDTSGDVDVLVFSGSIHYNDLKIESDKSNLVVHYTDKDSVTILDYFGNGQNKIEFVEFGENQPMPLEQGFKR